MRSFKNILRFSTIFNKSLPTYKHTNKFITTVLFSGFVASTFYFSNSKVLNEEIMTFEIDDNLKEGQMREIQVGAKVQDTIIVAKYDGKVYSVSGKCSHFGLPLGKGILVGDKLICPFHNAGFDIKTGKVDQGPTLTNLKTFNVEVKNGKIKVSVPKDGWQQYPSPPQMDPATLDKNKKIVIIGAGTAALSAADTLRQTGYTGLIYMITKQKYSPYDRTLLSKMSDDVKKPSQFRSKDYYQQNGIILVSESNVVGIDYEKKKVKLQSKQPLNYDKLLIASGCVNVQPKIKGLDTVNFNTVRTINDYEKLNKEVRQSGVKNITIIGGGFIGLQTASALKLALKQKINVTVIQANPAPLAHIFGEEVSKMFIDLSSKNGVNIINNAKVKQIVGNNKKPSKVVLESGDVPTDVLIMATGVKTAVDFAQQLVEKEFNGIKTNVYLQTDKKDVYAAGDIATYPYWYTGNRVRIQHYNEATYQGSVAALNMVGKKFPMDNIPFFWTRSFNNTLCLTGFTKGWDYVHIVGNVKQMKFIAYYINKKEDKVLGAAAINQLGKLPLINEAMRNGVMPKASVVMAPDFKLESVTQELKKKNPKCSKCTMCEI